MGQCSLGNGVNYLTRHWEKCGSGIRIRILFFSPVFTGLGICPPVPFRILLKVKGKVKRFKVKFFI